MKEMKRALKFVQEGFPNHYVLSVDNPFIFPSMDHYKYIGV